MAKRKRSRSGRNFVAIPFAGSLALGALADDAVISVQVTVGEFTDDLFVMSLDVRFGENGHAAGEGPILLGLSHSDYTVAEIIEAIDIELLGKGDKIEQERARRLVRKFGLYDVGAVGDAVVISKDEIGRRHKLNWPIGIGNSLDLWARNKSGATLTTGQIVSFSGTLYGRWQ